MVTSTVYETLKTAWDKVKTISECPVCHGHNIKEEMEHVKVGYGGYYNDLGCSYCVDCGVRFKYPKGVTKEYETNLCYKTD